jgi:hypothetical protein
MSNNKFNPIVESIFLLKIMYIISFPLAKIFARFNINPNTITTISNISIVVALYFLYIENIVSFICFWMLAEIFDICDGTVARLTNKSSESGAFYDHFSDQVKIFLFFIAISLYFDDNLITYISFLSAGIFLLYIDISKRIEIFKLKYPQNQKKNKNELYKTSILRQIYNHIFLIHGHTMVLIPFMAVSKEFAMYGLVLFLFIAVKNFLGALRQMIRLLNGV